MTNETGSSDSGTIFTLLFLSLAVSILMAILSWVSDVKNARIAKHIENAVNSDNVAYREPGAYRVTY